MTAMIDKVFDKQKKNQAKLSKTKNIWYLLLRKFGPLLPKINFWMEHWTLACVHTKF